MDDLGVGATLANSLAVGGLRPRFRGYLGYAAHCAFGLINRTEGLQYAKKSRDLGDSCAHDGWDDGAYDPRRWRPSNGSDELAGTV